MKKGVEAVENITGTQATGGAADTPIEGGGTLRNPLKKIVDVQLVGAYGKSTSNNYGEVSLVFK